MHCYHAFGDGDILDLVAGSVANNKFLNREGIIEYFVNTDTPLIARVATFITAIG